MLTLSTWLIFHTLLLLMCCTLYRADSDSTTRGLINMPVSPWDDKKSKANREEGEEEEELDCFFPPHMRGYWVRSQDYSTISFYSNAIFGVKVNVSDVELSSFQCYEVVGNLLIMRDSFEDENRNWRFYYQCWQVNRVTESVYIVYDLSETLHYGQGWKEAKRNSYSITSPPGVNQVCPRFDSNELYTIFYKNDTNFQTLRVECPPSLMGVFTYSTTCKQSSLDFCSVRYKGVINFTLCQERLVDSSDGIITCLGFRDKDRETYASFFIDKRVICFVFPRIFKWTFTGKFYSGDCTTAKDKPVLYVSFVLTKDCNEIFSTAVSDAISWRRASDWLVSIETVLACLIIVNWEHLKAAGFHGREINVLCS